MLPIIGWIMLWFRPSWGFLIFFGLCIGVLSLVISLLMLGGVGVLSAVPIGELATALGADFAWNVGVFVAIGAIIVALRGGKLEKRAPNEKEIDAELARIRAEAAAREQGRPPA